MSPLLQAATPLLLLAGRLRGALSPMDIDGLRRQVLDDVQQFEHRASAAGVANDVVLTARYAICAALDEAVLSTPWGSVSAWAQQPLLATLHHETWGGEKFFEILDRVTGQPETFLDLMEIQYLCLVFGFTGKYQVKAGGEEQLIEVRRAVARRLRERRPPPEPDLSLRWRGLDDQRNPVARHVPPWIVAAGALALAGATFVFYYTSLEKAAAPLHAKLTQVGRATPAPGDRGSTGRADTPPARGF